MAVAATIGLDEIEPLLLCLEVLGHSVALVAGAGKAALVRDLQCDRVFVAADLDCARANPQEP